MTSDVSYHPIDVNDIQGAIVPALLAGDGLPELEARAARLAKVRYLAKAWALGALAASRATRERAERQSAPAPPPSPGLLGRLFGRGPAEASAAPAAAPAWTSQLHPDVHAWGRPYFITAEEPSEISAAIDTWLASSPEDVESLARAMALRVAPELGPLTEPDLEAGLPRDEAFLRAVNEPLAACREVLRALEAGEMFAHPDGGEIDPADLVGPDFAFLLVRIASWSRPGWMARGPAPSALVPDIPDASQGWQPATRLLAPILERHPRAQPSLSATLERDEQVGGFLVPEDVPRLRAALEARRESLLAAGLDAASWGKLRESLLDAESRGLAFLEASGIYSASAGALN